MVPAQRYSQQRPDPAGGVLHPARERADARDDLDRPGVPDRAPGQEPGAAALSRESRGPLSRAARHMFVGVLGAAVLSAGVPAFAQVSIAGEWDPATHEDQLARGPGPAPGGHL